MTTVQASGADEAGVGVRDDLSALLRLWRRRSGLSQERLAEAALMSVRGVRALESGSRRTPYPATIARIAQALDLSPGERLLLAGAAADPRPPAPVPTEPPRLAADGGRAAVPVPPGRAEVVALVTGLVPVHRLVTLTGTGGVGKTTVAGAVAEQLGAAGWRVDVVPLVGARHADELYRDLAAGLGWRPSGAVSELEALPRLLSDERRRLLVLDNLEQVRGAASAMTNLMQACPAVHWLLTSRTALGLSQERRVTLDVLDPQTAVDVLLRRAGMVSEQQIDHDRAAQLAERLDRLPLALTLAGYWLRATSPEDLLAELTERSAGVLAHDDAPVDLPDRHRSLAATVEHSLALLSVAGVEVARAVAVHAGTVAAADLAHLCAAPPEATRTAVTELVDSGLVAVDTTGAAGTRYRMLPTVAACTRLSDPGLRQRREQHAIRVVARVKAARELLRGPQMVAALADVETRAADCRSLLQRWTVEDPARAADLVVQLWPSWYLAGRWADLEAAAEAVRADLPARGRAGLAVVLARRGRTGPAREVLLAAQPDEPASERAEVRYAQGLVEALSGDADAALTHYSVALAAAQDGGETGLVAEVRCYAGYTRWRSGDLAGAAEDFAAALSGATGSGHRWGVARALFGQAELAVVEGRWDRARPVLTRMQLLDAENGYRRGVEGAAMLLAVLDVQQDRPGSAKGPLEHVSRYFADLGDMLMLSTALSALALACARTGDVERARRLLGDVDELRAPVSFVSLHRAAREAADPA